MLYVGLDVAEDILGCAIVEWIFHAEVILASMFKG